MGHLSNWSNDSQAMTRICVLESQNEVKDVRLATLTSENIILKQENARLRDLVTKLLEKTK
jgi:hypothetical protein